MLFFMRHTNSVCIVQALHTFFYKNNTSSECVIISHNIKKILKTFDEDFIKKIKILLIFGLFGIKSREL